MQIIETSVFTRQVQSLLTDDDHVPRQSYKGLHHRLAHTGRSQQREGQGGRETPGVEQRPLETTVDRNRQPLLVSHAPGRWRRILARRRILAQLPCVVRLLSPVALAILLAMVFIAIAYRLSPGSPPRPSVIGLQPFLLEVARNPPLF